MRSVLRHSLRALLGVVAGILAACGGGGGGGGVTQSSVNRAVADSANHAPVLDPIADASNSATAPETRIRARAIDPDGDGLSLAVTTAEAAVASASIDAASGDIVIEPHQRGRTTIAVTASDGELSATTTFRFTVGDVTRSTQVEAAEGEAIVLVNATDGDTEFVLTHNGFRTYQSTTEIVAEIDAMAPRYPGEPFEERLWRLVRDNTWHDVPLNPANWLSSPTVLINSLGWGFCHNVAAAYAEIARVGGYQSRVWGLNGHVVPEVSIGGRWALYDSDLAVYYRDATGRVAGVEELAADPSLITSPVTPVQPTNAFAYSTEVAGIYASPWDNTVDDRAFGGPDSLAPPDVLNGRVTLPAHARLTYQGRWTEAPVTDVPQEDDTTINEFKQAAITLATGWTGSVSLPWILWDVTGTGSVSIDGTGYAIGSPALQARLRGTTEAPSNLDINSSAGPVRLVFLINPLRYEVRNSNRVELTGLSVWRVQVGVEALPEANRAGAPFPAGRRKPAG